MTTLRTEDRTEASVCDARIVRGAKGLQVNRALAERLAVVHRMVYELSVPVPTGEPEPITPEEKLLRAIFGEAVDGMPKYDTPEVGAEVNRGDWLIGTTPPKVVFWEAATGTIESTERTTSGLPADLAERITVVVRFAGPLTRGDALRAGGDLLGVVDAIVDDGDSDPRVYVVGSERSARVERALPTAAQRMFGRSVGPYDPRTRAPRTGAILRDDQIEWLAGSGGRAVIGEVAAYTTGDPLLGVRAYEDLVNDKPIADGFSVVRPVEKKDEGAL